MPVSGVGGLTLLQHGEPREIRNHKLQGPGLPPPSTSVKASTVEGGAELRTRTRLPECSIGADAHRRRVGGDVKAPGHRERVEKLLYGRRTLLLGLGRDVRFAPTIEDDRSRASRAGGGVLQRRGAEEERRAR